MKTRLSITIAIITSIAFLSAFVVPYQDYHLPLRFQRALQSFLTDPSSPAYTRVVVHTKEVPVEIEKLVLVEKEIIVPVEHQRIVYVETKPTPTKRPSLNTNTTQVKAEPKNTPQPTPSPKPTPTQVRKATRTPRPTPTPVHTPSGPDLHALHIHTLELVNASRAKHGVPPVNLGRNNAAQLHAEDTLANCFSSHWNLKGLKPIHRYTLAGGTGTGHENGSGRNYCIKQYDNYQPNDPPEMEIEQTHQRLMNSPAHRQNILDPSHTLLNVGVAYDRYNFNFVQQFSSDYVKYSVRPRIKNKRLELKGTVKNATLSIKNATNFTITYHPPPKRLTRGQIVRTYSTCWDPTVGTLQKKLPPGWSYNSPQVTTQTTPQKCINPYNLDPHLPPPTSAEEAHEYWKEAKNASQTSTDTIQAYQVRITADEWAVYSHSFDVAADITPLLVNNGPGIYTLNIYGQPDHMTEPTVLSSYSIFWQTQPP